MAEIIVTKENFENEVLNATKTVLLDFWAEWCGPCRMIAPIVEEIAREHAETIIVGKINVDEQSELANMFRINSIPTLAVVKDGEITNMSVGYKTKQQILELL